MALRNVTLEHLIAAAAHLEAPNKQGRAPLHVAAASDNFRALRKLLNAGAHRAPIDAVNHLQAWADWLFKHVRPMNALTQPSACIPALYYSQPLSLGCCPCAAGLMMSIL